MPPRKGRTGSVSTTLTRTGIASPRAAVASIPTGTPDFGMRLPRSWRNNTQSTLRRSRATRTIHTSIHR